MTLDPLEDARALRERVAISESPHVVVLRVCGDGAFDAVNAVSTAALHLGDAQMRPTLLLRDDGSILADAYVCRDDEAFWLVAEGAPSADLAAHVARRAPSIRVEERCASHRVVGVHGPYAWELLGEALDPDVVGIPFLSLYGVGDVTCFRAGKTGEYGYELLVPRDQADALTARLRAAGAAFEAREIAPTSVDLASLENGFYCPRHAPRITSPFERQLRWRIAFERTFVGSAALPALAAASARRLVHAVASAAPSVGGAIELDGAVVGSVEHVERSPLLDAYVVLALVDAAIAHPGIDELVAVGGVPLATRAPPLVDNRSLYVSPQRHAFASRATDAFPPIIAP